MELLEVLSPSAREPLSSRETARALKPRARFTLNARFYEQ